LREAVIDSVSISETSLYDQLRVLHVMSHSLTDGSACSVWTYTTDWAPNKAPAVNTH